MVLDIAIPVALSARCWMVQIASLPTPSIPIHEPLRSGAWSSSKLRQVRGYYPSVSPEVRSLPQRQILTRVRVLSGS